MPIPAAASTSRASDSELYHHWLPPPAQNKGYLTFYYEDGFLKSWPDPTDGGSLKKITVLESLSPTNIKAELDSTVGDSAPSFTTVKYWVAELKQGCTSCQDEHRSGQPNEVMPTKMLKTYIAVRGDR
ncbi:mariner transposase [Trichonephila clavipes]|nr:mariner transposase [Trichonephila clavipes]